MHNSRDLRRKEVIDIHTAEKLGMVCDIDVDLGTGHINSLILPSGELFAPLFGKRREIVIPWSAVVAIGREYILVETCGITDLSL